MVKGTSAASKDTTPAWRTARNKASHAKAAAIRADQWRSAAEEAERTGFPVVTPPAAKRKAARRAEQRTRKATREEAAAIQARTCRGTVQLLDWDSRRFSRRHLVMGLSRATSIEAVWLGP